MFTAPRKAGRFLIRLLRPGKTFTHQVLRAGFWTALIRSGLRLVGFARNVILARLLAPDDFGLFGIALVILSIIERFSDTGLKSALVQKKADIHDHMDTAFTVQAVRGAVLALLLLLSAPYVAQFFDEPRATPFVQLLAATVFLRGIRSMGLILYTRELEVRRQNLHRVASDVVELAVSIVAAILLQNAWALMIGMLAGNVISVVVSYRVHPYRPRLHFRLDYARELGRYGRWVFLNNILFFLAYRGDNLVIGKFLGAPALGIYLLAYSISEVATREFSQMVTHVAFPAYSRIQGELQRLQRAYATAIELVASVTLPAAVVLWLLAEPLTLALLGVRWLEVASVLPLLAFAGVIRTLVSNGSAAFKAVGRPDRSLLVSVVGVVATYAAIFPLMNRFGLVGVGMAVLLGQLASLPPYLFQARLILGVGWRLLVRALVPAGTLSIAVALPLGAMHLLLPQIRMLELILAVLAASLSYLAVAYLLWHTRHEGPLRLLQIASGKPKRKRGASRKATAVQEAQAVAERWAG